MQTLLMELRNPNVRAYFVWGPYLKSDTEAAAREISERAWAPNSVYFWTPGQKLSPRDSIL